MTDSQFSNKVRVRSCAIIVQDSSILLAKMNAPTRTKPIWMPPGGGVELGETLEQALKREVAEESNLEIEVKQPIWVHEFIEKPFHAIEFYFRCELAGGRLKKGFDPEIDVDNQMLLDLKFVTFLEATHLDIEPTFIKDFCKNGGRFPEGLQLFNSFSKE